MVELPTNDPGKARILKNLRTFITDLTENDFRKQNFTVQIKLGYQKRATKKSLAFIDTKAGTDLLHKPFQMLVERAFVTDPFQLLCQ